MYLTCTNLRREMFTSEWNLFRHAFPHIDWASRIVIHSFINVLRKCCKLNKKQASIFLWHIYFIHSNLMFKKYCFLLLYGRIKHLLLALFLSSLPLFHVEWQSRFMFHSLTCFWKVYYKFTKIPNSLALALL